MTLVASLAVLSACGGGGSSPSPAPNTVPVANAGPNQSVAAGAQVSLDASASSDADGSIAGYTWSQTAGTVVTLSSTTSAQPTFTAPSPAANSTLTFSLRVTDNRGGLSAPASVSISVTPAGGPNTAPMANAGSAQTVNSGALVTLDGSGSNDSDGSISSYAWTQTAGTAVALSSANSPQPSFTAPSVTAATTLTFSLAVTDDDGAASTASTVNVMVNPGSAGNVSGRITFVRIPFGASLNAGLDYAKPLEQPARGVTVRALAAGTNDEIARTVTGPNGDYAMNVAAGTSITIEVLAEMLRTGPLPNWNFTVRDLPPPDDPGPFPDPLPPVYAYTDGQAFAAGGAAKDLLIPSGLSTTGNAIGTRASAPFAILDTFYQAAQLVLGARPNVNFPALVADWGVANVPGDGTFFTTADVQHMVLTADLSADTDEFDQHVIAHEFGHYVEYNFSRADNIGGSHGVGDKLDPRVAFGEGFGYAFGAMALGDPVSRDSFVDDGFGCPNDQCSSTFNVQTNPPKTSAGSNFGCWCSESSVWSILWDVFDNDAEPGDTVRLGFTPIWNVLVGPQRTTPAFTTIFSFITALKQQNSSSAGAINTLVAAQNINGANIDIYGSMETFVPTPFTSAEVLPIYAPATLGVATTLRTTNRGGPNSIDASGNKLSNHRFIRFTATGNPATVTATSTNPASTRDVDFFVYRANPFGYWRSATSPPAASEVLTFPTAAAEYLIDAYDCANGCEPSEGTPGAYDLTVTIN